MLLNTTQYYTQYCIILHNTTPNTTKYYPILPRIRFLLRITPSITAYYLSITSKYSGNTTFYFTYYYLLLQSLLRHYYIILLKYWDQYYIILP